MNRIDILKTACGFIVSNAIAASFAFAGSMGVGLTDSKGEVILFCKEGCLIAIKESEISMATFAPVKAGTFLMGSPSDEVDRDVDEFQHEVTLTQDFEIQTTEVTQLQYFLVMGYNPSYFKKEKYCSGEHQVINGEELCPNHPVERVSWDDVQAFIVQLNKEDDRYTYGTSYGSAMGVCGSGVCGFWRTELLQTCGHGFMCDNGF